MRSIFALAILTTTAAADPKPARLQLQTTDGTNLHMADQRGAIHTSEDIKVTVDLLKAGRLEAVATGWRKQHNLDVIGGRNYNTDDETKFTLKWTGAWSETPGKLVLDLTLASETCAHTKKTNDEPPETLACRRANKGTRLECTAESVELEDLANPARKTKVPVWSCSAKDFDDLGESPHWILGKTTCIKSIGGRMSSMLYRKC